MAASSSIPSKYQTIVVDNSERKGFLSRAKRFQGLGAVVRKFATLSYSIMCSVGSRLYKDDLITIIKDVD